MKKINLLICSFIIIFVAFFSMSNVLAIEAEHPCWQYDSSTNGKNECNNGTGKYACVWNEKYGFCNTDQLTYVACGGAREIPSMVPELVSFAVNLLKIATPIILVLVSVISLFKAMAASKEDEIKKAQSSLIRRIIAAVLVFFVVSIVQFVIFKVSDNNDENDISSCLDCFLNNKCEKTTYYKASVNGEDICRTVDGNPIDCE